MSWSGTKIHEICQHCEMKLNSTFNRHISLHYLEASMEVHGDFAFLVPVCLGACETSGPIMNDLLKHNEHGILLSKLEL